MGGILLGQVFGASAGGVGAVAWAGGSVTHQWSCSYGFMPDGHTRRSRGSIVDTSGTWLVPGSGADQFEIRAVLSSGNTPTGDALNTWLNLGSTRSWGLSTTGLEKSCELAVEIRQVSDGTVVASGSIDLFVAGNL